MRGYIKESHQGGVYSRLYLDSTVRKRKQENLERLTTTTTDSNVRPRAKIETLLLQKHAKSQAKISTLRKQQQQKEIEDIKPVPRINKISKQIAEAKEGHQNELVSLYAAKLMNTSRSASTARLLPKQSFLSLLDLEHSGDFKNVIRVQEEAKELETDKFVVPTYANLKHEKDEAKEREMQELRKAVFERCRIAEPVEPASSILNLNLLDRNNQWLKNRESRISQKMEKAKKEESSFCTFTPKIAPRIEQGLNSTKSTANMNSYSAMYSNKQVGKPAIEKKDEVVPEKKQEKKVMLYKSLSPHERSLSQGQSLKLLARARPMISYNL